MKKLTKAILVSSLALVMFEAMAGGPSGVRQGKDETTRSGAK